jgi:histidyl-tRNA synthetase
MRRFRAVERQFLDTVAAHGYEEIRTPAIEPLHLFTATSALSPQLLDRVYSFLDWDGWSGERVVLRPDATVPVARWYEEHWQGTEPARLCYVEPVYRFVPAESGQDDGEREQWQCGVELFGLAAPEGDVELLLLARDLMESMGLHDVRVELSHAGLVRSVLSAAGIDLDEQAEAYEHIIAGGPAAANALASARSEFAPALRLLFMTEGGLAPLLENLRAALPAAVSGATLALDELAAVTSALDATGCTYRVLPSSARNFEYYTGLTFRVLAGDVECASGGRYDGLGEAIGGRLAPASGFGADLLRLARVAEAASR